MGQDRIGNLKKQANAHPKSQGKGGRLCRQCANPSGMIRKYGINMCRQCFRENAALMGFKKFN